MVNIVHEVEADTALGWSRKLHSLNQEGKCTGTPPKDQQKKG